METVHLTIDGMSCNHCVGSVRKALEVLSGVQVDDVRVGAAQLRIDRSASTVSVQEIIDAVSDAGYEARVQAQTP